MSIPDVLVTVHGSVVQREKTAEDAFAETFVKWAAPEPAEPGRLETNKRVDAENTLSPTEPLQAHDPSPNKASNPGRSDEHETFSENAEKATVTDGIEVLLNALANMGEARRVDQQTVSELFDHGKPGQYLTRSRTLAQQVKDLK